MDKIETFFTELMSWVAAEQRNHGAPLTVGHIVSVCATMVIEEYIPPIIEAKDKEIEAKDKRISELEAEKYRQNEKYEELARLYGKTVNDLSAANTGKELLKAEVKKVMGLLKEEFKRRYKGWKQSDIDKKMTEFCKEHHITP